MTRVIANMSMSLDGFVADHDERVDLLFGWYGNGPIVTPTANPGVTFRTSQRDADHIRAEMAGVGALITGRHLFDYAQGWGGRHPLGVSSCSAIRPSPKATASPTSPIRSTVPDHTVVARRHTSNIPKGNQPWT